MSFSNQTCLRAALVLTIISGMFAGTATAQSALGYSPAVDFNSDGFPDLAEHHTASGVYYVRLNNGNGTFQPQGTWWSTGTTSAPSPTWTVLIGEFHFTSPGTSYGDYLDIHRPSGQVWVHPGTAWGPSTTGIQLGNVSTDPNVEFLVAPVLPHGTMLFEHNRVTGSLFARLSNMFPLGTANIVTQTGSDWRTAFCDMNSDLRPDLIQIQVSTAQFWVHLATDTTGLNYTGLHVFSAFGFANPSFTTIFGDYNRDGYCDYADVNRSSGQFWVHLNNGNGTFNPANYATGFYTPNAGFSIMGNPISLP
jgi:hypothetical protein